LADLQWTVYPHSGHPLAEGRAQDMVSSPAKDRRSANCAMQQLYVCSTVKLPDCFVSRVLKCWKWVCVMIR